ncbi:MAG: adenylate cyclase [Actinomycetota bacterium]|jgi:adenylate cyclase|nr:adenylate cyclase [Actinomycetota bacterium]
MAEHGAIVFTDIVGFTALTDMHGDDVALALLERQERMVRAALPSTSRVVKELGDGLLLWFDDPSEAIDTCLRLQRDFDFVNEAADVAVHHPERSADGIADVNDVPLWVRMGVHWGCPRRRGDDIVGRDVNLAARIVDLAGPGEVLCSEATADAIGMRPGVGFEPLGPVFVRGIAEPVPIVRVLTAIDVDWPPESSERADHAPT